MNEGTTIAGQIERLIVRLDGAAVCDACVTDRLNLSVTAQANVVTCALACRKPLPPDLPGGAADHRPGAYA